MSTNKFDPKLVELLADKKFEPAIRGKDIDAIREYVQVKLGLERITDIAGTFDLDFDSTDTPTTTPPR